MRLHDFIKRIAMSRHHPALVPVFLLLTLLGLVGRLQALEPAPSPEWWEEQEVLTSAAPRESAPATIGQLKHVVWSLAKALDEHYTSRGGAGDELRTTVRTWDRNFPSTASAAAHTPSVVKDGDMLAVANQGQLKNLAHMAYRRMKVLNLPIKLKDRDAATGALKDFVVDPDTPAMLPWGARQNTAPALLGQLKFCFSFDLTTSLGRGGRVVAWGNNDSGEVNVPAGLDDVVTISAGGAHNLALISDGTVVAWGSNNFGQSTVPDGLSGIVSISAGSHHSLALKSDGTVVAWGANHYGQSTVPNGLSGVVAVEAGANHCLALTTNGTLIAWGDNSSGQCMIPFGLNRVLAVSGGASHSLALRTDGTIVAWGRNVEGQASVPLGLRGVVAIAAGADHNLALKIDGSVVAWGRNRFGEIAVPTNLSGVVAVSAGESHSLALKGDGTLDAWGYDNHSAFEVPIGLSGVATISAGGVHAVALIPNQASPTWISGTTVIGQFGFTLNRDYYRSYILKGPATFTATGLPPGLTIDPSTGVVSCTPTAQGEWTATLFATNTEGTTSQQVRFNLSELSPKIDAQPEGNILLAEQYGFQIQVQNASSVTVSGLPPGLSFDPVSFTIAGRPTLAGRFSVTVEVVNTFGVVSSVKSVTVANLLYWGYGNGFNDALTNCHELEIGEHDYVALKMDGTVVEGSHPASDANSRLVVGLDDAVAIAAGRWHRLALKSDGTVVAWGNNDSGQCDVPAGLSGVVAISAGSYHSLALKGDGTVVGWGANASGQSMVPVGLHDVVAISAATVGGHSLALKSDGTVVAWGSNQSGQSTVPPDLRGVVAVAAGGHHSLAVLSDGTAVAWGDDYFGQTRVNHWRGVVAITAGAHRSVGLKVGGSVLTSGRHYDPQSDLPQELTGVRAVDSGLHTSVALLYEGRLPVWISGTFAPPLPGNSLSGEYYHSCVLGGPVTFGAIGLPPGLMINPSTGVVSGVPTAEGRWTATLSATNAEGATTREVRFNLSDLSPKIDAQPEGRIGMARSYSFQMRIRNASNIDVVGLPPGLIFDRENLRITGIPTLEGTYPVEVTVSNPFGTVSSNKVLQVPPVVAWGYHSESEMPEELDDAVAISAGGGHSLALRADGTVVAWGSNFSGQSTVPTALVGVVAISAGGSHSLALKSDGTVVAWGSNTSGQCSVPPELGEVLAVAAGGSHSLALISDGTVVAWGHNANGQSTPPADLRGVVAISAGSNHSIALKSNGRVAAWGDQFSGKGTVPPDLSSVVSIAAGGSHNLALKSDGTVAAWGSNSGGQSDVPVGLSGVVAISAGTAHNLALKDDGKVVAWGYNGYGQTLVPTSLRKVVGISAGGYGSLALVAHQSAPAWHGGGLVSGAIGGAHTGNFYHARILNGPAAFNASGLPPGLQMDPNTGSVSGTPTAQGEWTATLSATNAAGTITQQVRFNLSDLSPKIDAQPEGSILLAQPYFLRLSVRNASSVTVSGLPPDLSFDPESLSISGSPSVEGMYPVGVTVINPFGTASSTKVLHVPSVVGWGGNDFGQTMVPVGTGNLIAVQAGGLFTLALKVDGTVVAWGYDNVGPSIVPEGLGGVVAISTGEGHSLALKSDGTVSAWGNNHYGESTVPVGLGGVVAIAAGSSHSLALKSDGTVVAWGPLDHAGDPIEQSRVPAGLQSVVAISAGAFHSLALKSDGTAVGWGATSYHGLDVGQKLVPAGLREIVLTSAGLDHSVALLKATGAAPLILSPVATIAYVGRNRTHYQALESSGTATFTATGLPPGLNLDSDSGAVTGTPTTAGTYEVNLAATNTHGSASRTVRFYVNP